MAVNLEVFVQDIIRMVPEIEPADSTVTIAVKIDPVTDNVIIVGRSSKTSIICISVVKRQEIEDNTCDVRACLLSVVYTLAVAEHRPRRPEAKGRMRGAVVGFPDVG